MVEIQIHKLSESISIATQIGEVVGIVDVKHMTK